ncbi:MAG: type II toxin-antitoxin system VapC family toxin [Nitrospirae bacterium]|nr:type II toxin-antitoxin system VapC family toxin [Nitrospirota bacterium]
MKHYLFDTNILGHLADLKDGNDSTECKALDKHMKERPEGTKILVCPISVGEVEYGVRVAPPDYDKQKLERFRKVVYEYSQGDMDINANLARNCYSVLRAKLYDHCFPSSKKKQRVEEWMNPTTSKELQIQENDLWIASVAMAYNLILVTQDKMNVIKTVAGNDITFENWLV